MNLAHRHQARGRRLQSTSAVAKALLVGIGALLGHFAVAAEPSSPSNRGDASTRFEVSADAGSAARLLSTEPDAADDEDNSRDTPAATDGQSAETPAPERSSSQRESASPRPAQAPRPESAPPPAEKPAPLRQPGAESPPNSRVINRFERVEEITAEAENFNGIRPGASTRAELREKWGAPREVKKAGDVSRYVYSIDPFQQVVVSARGDRVYGIAIYLEKPVAARPLAKQLHLDDCEPAVVADSHGRPIGEVFPERGVMFAFSPTAGSGNVQQIVLEPIDAQTFLLRAESRLEALPAHALADAEFAVQLAPQLAVAHSLKARALDALARSSAARSAAEEALRLDPKNIEYRFHAAQLEIQTGDHQAAARILQRVLSQQPLPEPIEARAYLLWGDCLAHPARGDFAQAIEQHQQAVRLADALTRGGSATNRRLGKQLLIEAHLGAAKDVALGAWGHKNQSAAKWLTRAKWLAEDGMAKGEIDRMQVLRVYETAMTVLAAAPGKTPATDWIAGLQRVSAEAIDAAAEASYRGSLQWRLGLALADAVTIEEIAGHATEALQLGETAAGLLADAQSTIESPDRDARVGRLYYRLGALEAIERHNHVAAVVWYDRATPIIETMLSAKNIPNPGQHGDMLVSMAVSYWETGARETAVRLTQQGLRLLEDSVEAGALSQTALAVPYGNLASMLNHQGDTVLAGRYAELASRSERDLGPKSDKQQLERPVLRR